MNEITFGTKRAFHGFLKFTRKPLAQMGLTAARFDMLRGLMTARHLEWRWPWFPQRVVRRRLGVTAPVVTRMLKALEKLGLVVRRRHPRDKRQLEVRLTDEGERCIRAASRVMTRAVDRLVHEAICCGKHRNRDQRWIHMDTLEGYLDNLRRMFGDTATLQYLYFHPDN